MQNKINLTPFILDSVAGILAVFGSFVWSFAGLLKEVGIVDVMLEVYIFLAVLFPTCCVLIVWAMVRYFRRKYIRIERK